MSIGDHVEFADSPEKTCGLLVREVTPEEFWEWWKTGPVFDPNHRKFLTGKFFEVACD